MFHGIPILLLRAVRDDTMKLRGSIVRIVFLGIVYLNLFFAQVTSLVFGAPGLQFLTSMSYVSYAAITLAGILLFPVVISEDKESGMIDILRIAGIEPLSLLLGKSTGLLLTSLLLLLLQFPFVLLAITLGGVTMAQVIAVTMDLAAYLILLANTGLFFSVVMTRNYYACGCNALVAAVLYALSYAPMAAIRQFSVGDRLTSIFQTGFNETTLSPHFLVSIGGGMLFFLLAYICFRTLIVTRPAVKQKIKVANPVPLNARTSRRFGSNPFLTKDFFFMAGGWKMFGIRHVLYCLVFLALKVSVSRSDQAQVVCIGLTTFLILEICLMSARVFHEEIHHKTLPSLILLPESMKVIGYSKAAGCMLALAPNVFWLLVGALACEGGSLLLFEWITSPAIWACVAQGVMIMHMSVLLSLTIRWWVITLIAALVTLVSLWPITFFMVNTIGGFLLIPSVVISLLITLAMHVGIGHALRTAARNC